MSIRGAKPHITDHVSLGRAAPLSQYTMNKDYRPYAGGQYKTSPQDYTGSHGVSRVCHKVLPVARIDSYRLSTLAPAPTFSRFEWFVLDHRDMSDPLDTKLTLAVKVWLGEQAYGAHVTLPGHWYKKIGRLTIMALPPWRVARWFGFSSNRRASQSDPLAQRGHETRLTLPCLSLWWRAA